MKIRPFSWGTFLVLVGGLFLLHNMGVIHTSVWQLIWPLLIIWWGVQMVGSSMERSSENSNQEFRYVVPIKGVEEAHIRVKHQSGGRLQIHADTAPDELLAGNFGAEGVAFDAETDGGDVLHLDMRPPTPIDLAVAKKQATHWQFGLNEDVPISLNLDTGTSQAELDLEDLTLTELRLHADANETAVTLPAQAGYTLVQIDAGAADVHLKIPEGVAAHIRSQEGWEQVRVNEARFPRVGNVHESEAYDSAPNQVDIHIQAGVKRVIID